MWICYILCGCGIECRFVLIICLCLFLQKKFLKRSVLLHSTVAFSISHIYFLQQSYKLIGWMDGYGYGNLCVG